MKLAAPVALLLLLAAIVAGCGGGGTTTVVEKTVTVESEGGAAEEETSGGDTAGEESSGGDTTGGDSAGKDTTGGDTKSGGTTDTKGGDTSGGESKGSGRGQPEDKIEEPTAVVHLQSFRSPSGNIGCIMFEGGARCDIRKREWAPPARPSSCSEQVDFGQGLAVGHDGAASFVCAGDTALDPAATALGYGEASEMGGTVCISRTEGITCANHSGHGFFISIQSYKLF
jgi:hypothetical protein